MKKIFFAIFCFYILNSFAQKTELVIRNGHSDHINDIAFSPGKKLMASAGRDGSIVLWDSKTGLQIKQYMLCKKEQVYSVAFSNDGKFIAAAGTKKVAIIDAVTTNLLDSFSFESLCSAVAFTPDSKYLLSADHSGFINVWRMSDRKHIAKINPYDGMYDTKYDYFSYIRSIAISPDGKKLAVGCDDGYGLVCFRIPEDDDGWNHLIKLGQPIKIEVGNLAFVGTGKYLVVHTGSPDYSLITYDAETLKQISKIKNTEYDHDIANFSDAHNDEFIYAKTGLYSLSKLALPSLKTIKVLSDTTKVIKLFVEKNTNHLFATFFESESIIEYNTLQFKKPDITFIAGTNLNIFTAISPDSKFIAVSNEQGVLIYDIEAGKIIKKLKVADEFLRLASKIHYDTKGTFFYVNQNDKISKWSTATWKLNHEFIYDNGIVSEFCISSNDKYLAAVDNGNYPVTKIWDLTTNAVVATQKSVDGIEMCTFSHDNTELAIIGGLKTLTVLKVPSLEKIFEAEKTVTGENLMFTPDDAQIYTFQRNAIFSTPVKDNKTTLLYSDGEPSPYGYPVWGLGVAPDKKSFVMNGSGTSIKHCDMQTALPFVSMNDHSSIVRSISYSPDGKFYLSADWNGEIIIRSSNDSILCRFFSVRETAEWIVVMPDGRFDASMDALGNLYFHKATEILPLSSLFEKFFTPHLLPRLLQGEKFASLDVDINNVKNKPLVKLRYAEKARNLEVGDATPIYNNTTGVADITINATAPEDKIEEIRLFHNGKVVNLATRGLFVTDNDGTETKKYTINLLPGNNNFRALALNSQRTESAADEIIVNYTTGGTQPSPPPASNKINVATISTVDKNATMYLMVVGINAYTNKINPLKYALPDATSFKDEIEKDAKSVLANVKTYFITDTKADKVGIINAFNEIKKDAKQQDVFVFYYAGHGYINPDNKEFYLVSADVANGGESLLKNGIPAKELQQYAVDIQAQKQLFILDACQSAGAFNAMLQHDGEQQKSLAVVARSTGTHWMAASGSTETAKEFGELGHGAFTYVLLQALKGQAATNKMITVNGMKNFLQVQVPELVKKYGSNNQYPASYGFGNDFPVEIVK